MPRKSNKTAMAFKSQAAAYTFDAPSAVDDIYPISALRYDIQGVTVENPEYTGRIHRHGPDVAGKRLSGSFNINMRPPGGADLPAANGYIPGRLLKAAKFAEVRTTSAIPAAPEALGAGSDEKNAVLGASATGTAGLYKGMALHLSDNGATYAEQMTAIRAYAADKTATLMEELAASPAANWQIPKQLGFHRSVDESDAPFLSTRLWIDGLRYDLVDFRVSGMRWVVPVSTRDNAAIPTFEISFEATIHDTADEATPTVPSLGTTPLWKDGDFHFAYKAIGGSNLSVDFGLRAAYPPNPNFVDGSAGGELVETRTTVAMDNWAYLKAELDTLALAESQAQQPIFAQWGYSAGNMVQIVIPDARPNYRSPDIGGEFVTERGDIFVDVYDRNVCLNFPY